MSEPNKLKELPLDVKRFEANSKKYYISKSLSVERWRYYEDFQALVGFGRSYDDVFNSYVKIWEALDDKGGPKVATASLICHNAMTAIKQKLDERHHPALMICTLFVNYEGEDERIYDEEIMNSKIRDWQEEGYDISSFFRMAWNLVPGFIASFNADIHDTLNLTKKEKSSTSKGKK